MQTRSLLLGWAVLALAAASVRAGEPPDQSKWVSREEYDVLKKQLDSVVTRLNAVETKAQSAEASQAEYMEAVDKEIRQIQAKGAAAQPGTSMFLLTGEAFAGFTNARGSPNTFSAGFSPLVLWQVNDRILVETGLDLSLANDPDGSNAHTETELSSANISYELCDRLTVGAGLFTTPFDRYHNHFDATWINKLPDDPLAFGDGGIAPGKGVGVFVNGAAPVGSAQVNYSLYVTNGPSLVTSNDDNNAGSLNFDNFQDSNNNKAVGGRIGLRPCRDLEIGYSFMFARPSPSGFQRTDAMLNGFDVNYVKDIDAIKGTLTARAEWVWSHVDSAVYDPDGSIGFGPLSFNNDRNGGYFLVAYRPSKVNNDILKKLEFVFRYDRLTSSSQAPGGGTEQRWTPGVDYWLTPSTVLKLAYEFDQKDGAPDQNALLLMFAVGF